MTPEQIIREHVPSISDQDEKVMNSRFDRWDQNEDWADYALRTCSCGVRIDGFYEYVDHLIEMVHKGLPRT